MENINWFLIKDLYEKGKSLTKLSEEFNISRWIITKNLKLLGTDIINKQNILKFDNTVFDKIDTEEKAYWLGFIFADGCISDNTKCIYKNVFELSLKLSDINHLYKFNSFMKHTRCNVKYDRYRCRWNIMNEHLWKILNGYGCIPKKSLVLNFPDVEIFISKSLIRHFLRGYFDGDGCISFHRNVYSVTPTVSVLGTKDFLKNFIKWSNVDAKFKHDKRHSEHTFSLEYTKQNAIKIINWLYKDCTIFLDRKHKLYNFFKNGSRSVQEWNEWLSTKNGEDCDVNTVVTEETKASSVPYSVEIEPVKAE